MNDDRNVKLFGSLYDRDRDKTAFGKNDVWLQLLQKLFGLEKTFHDTKRVRKIFPVKVTAQLAGGDAMIRNTKLFDQLFFDAVVGADILYVIAQLAQTREQSNIRSDMTGSSATGKNDSFHR